MSRCLIRLSYGLLLWLPACGGPQADAPRTLQLVKIVPTSEHGVFLNEPLTFHFSADVDPLSVHGESVRVETESGERARGSLRVEGHKVIFQPDVPRARDLSDGGYRPGRRYLVRLEGFPRPDGIRGTDGEPLASTFPWSFDTVEVDEPRHALLFDDLHLERQRPPQIFPSAGSSGVYQIGVGDSIYLACEKPIDPTSLRSEDFSLRLGTYANPVTRDVGLVARLVENAQDAELRARPAGLHSLYSDTAWRSEKRASLIELKPLDPLLAGEVGYLRYLPEGGDDAWSMRDFSLRPLLPHGFAFRECKISVVEGAGFAGMDEIDERFVDKDLRSPLAVPESDGSAAWEGNGRVEVHYPLAAGDGSAGSVALAALQPLGDLQAVDLDLAPGQGCRLPDQPGLVLLRAQGRITLRGKLERRATLREPLDCAHEQGATLSSWLARTRAADPSWTVLIAGGDIVLEGKGEIDSRGPVLLVAGGQIRDTTGKTLAGLAPGQTLFWAQAGAGGARLHVQGPAQAQFMLDPPVGSNPLQRPLRYAVVSSPLPATGRVARWISAVLSGGFDSSAPGNERGTSTWSVRFFRADEPRVPEFSRASASLLLPEGPGALRFVVELVVGVGKDWQTPYVDRVQLSFERAPR